MKTKEELNTIKEEVENVKNKLAELNEDELKEVTGDIEHDTIYIRGLEIIAPYATNK